MAEKYEINFKWPHTEPREVIVTGTFDQWSSSVHLTKGVDGFEGKVFVPWGERVLYKFVVDGQWTNHDDQPKEADHEGNINNVYQAPLKPSLPRDSLSDASSAKPSTVPNGLADSEKPPLKKDQELPPVENVPVPDVSPSPIAAPATTRESVESAPAPSAAKEPVKAAVETAPLAMAGIPLTTEGEAFVPAAHSADGGAETPSQKESSTARGAENHAVNATEAPKPTAETAIPSTAQVPTTSVAPGVAESAKEPTVDASSAPSGQSQPISPPAVALSDAVVNPSASKPGEESPEAVHPAPQQAAVAEATPVQATETTAEKGVETTNEPPADSKVEPERPATPPPVYTNVSPSTPQKGESSKSDTPAATPSAPSTPANKHTFPSGGTVEDSGGSSKFGSQRKKRTSIFGKLKAVLSGDKEKK